MTSPRPARTRQARPASRPAVVPSPRVGEPDERPARADLWNAYQLAQQHYELDLQLFSTRMNLFLVIQSALAAFVGGLRMTGGGLVVDRAAVAVFGLALAAAWLVVALSSYMWVKTWRTRWIALGDLLNDKAEVEVSSRLFDQTRRRKALELEYGRRHRLWRQLEALSWFARPTLISCFLPLLFMVGWIYLGWLL